MKDIYYIQVKGNKFIEVEGTKVLISGFECFVHESLAHDKHWNVTEAITGMAVTQNYRYEKDAIERAEQLIKANQGWLKNMIEEKKEQRFVSPKYT
ncbi:hypothetical protein EBB07_29305 [Paenibacillaceae bacterium]|nr:hypothetical protein EBB07_29305 [Paenibacillaceae bacterium]